MTVHIPCTPTILRSINLLFASFILPGILSLLLSHQSPLGVKSQTPKATGRPSWRHFIAPSLIALVISFFPLIFFFGNLFYTDVASLTGVLGSYALASHGYHWTASLVSGDWSLRSQTEESFLARRMVNYCASDQRCLGSLHTVHQLVEPSPNS